MRIYVGNLSVETSEDELRAMFTPHGRVTRARLAKDKQTGAPRGFGIVEMEDEPARTAIAALQGARASGRKLRVKEAKPRPLSPEGSSGGTQTIPGHAPDAPGPVDAFPQDGTIDGAPRAGMGEVSAGGLLSTDLTGGCPGVRASGERPHAVELPRDGLAGSGPGASRD